MKEGEKRERAYAAAETRGALFDALAGTLSLFFADHMELRNAGRPGGLENTFTPGRRPGRLGPEAGPPAAYRQRDHTVWCGLAWKGRPKTAETQKRRTSLRMSFFFGTPEGTRTPSLQNRNLTLYPIALRARGARRFRRAQSLYQHPADL